MKGFDSPIDREAFTRMKQFSTLDLIAVKSSLVARWAHNPEAAGSNPVTATIVLSKTKKCSKIKKLQCLLDFFSLQKGILFFQPPDKSKSAHSKKPRLPSKGL